MSVLDKLREEQKDVIDKLSSLTKFIFGEDFTVILSKDHQKLLTDQFHVMTSYNEILMKRIMLMQREAE